MGIKVVSPLAKWPPVVLQTKVNPLPEDELEAFKTVVSVVQFSVAAGAILTEGKLLFCCTMTESIAEQPLAVFSTVMK